ncbi:serine hydrolase [Amycolatopsis coloradensis]|uniref:Serine hydrolase n=1 Tax=Amycolatopsis coloradensis TaxID=76021 RepID=A0A1R0KFP4_9PSEU|nr:serine hydrolase domain-containing protein [Amycolatopsis coloradensis]OLZ44269.1 serine hydrolase [Amycolatopsis coloradensis]
MRSVQERYESPSRHPVRAQDLQRVLNRLVTRHRVPGAQLAVLRDGLKTVVQTGVEHQDRQRPMRASSAVPTGSITKLATATVVMALVADDDLELDQPVGELLGVSGLSDRITPWNLLSHTSGLPSDPADVTSACLREVRAAVSVCPPGTAFSYSNLGYALVGALIEAVTGMSWREAVEAIVLRPLEIEPAYNGGERVVSGHAHATGPAAARPVEQSLAPMLEPAGALALSADDLVELGRVHLGKPGLLDVVTAADMHRRVPDADPFGLADGWGLGIAHYEGDDDLWLGHDGTADGTSCHLRIDQSGACVVAFTANGAAGTALWQDLVPELRTLGLMLPLQRPLTVTGPVPFPAGDFGTYRNGAIDYTIRPDDRGGAVLVVDGEIFADCTLHEDATFTVRDPATGRVTPCGRLRGAPGAATAIEVGGRRARRL